MKKTAFLSAWIIAALAVPALAQTNGTQPSRPQPSQPFGGVGVIDLKYVFDNYRRFQQMKTTLDAEVQEAEKQVKAKKDQIDNLVKLLKDSRLKPDSREYLTQEDEIRRKQADLSVVVDAQKKNFVRRESEMYATTYNEIKIEATRYAQQYNFGLILRFNGDGVENNLNPNEVMRELNKPVVIVHPSNDITPFVTDALNARYKPDSASRPGVPFNKQR